MGAGQFHCGATASKFIKVLYPAQFGIFREDYPLGNPGRFSNRLFVCLSEVGPLFHAMTMTTSVKPTS